MATTAQVYTYKGKDKRGKPIQGELKASSAVMVKAQLRKQGIAASRVKKKAKPLFTGQKPVKPQDIAIFTRQLATMMRAGVPLVQSFDLVGEGADKESLREIIYTIRDDVSSGISLEGALRKHPKHFDDLFCSLVGAGEQAGALETMLDRIATYKEKTESLKAKIKKALTYPIAVVLVAVIVTGILLVKVVPVFAETFSNFGADLPAFTQFVLGLSNTAQEWWFIWIISLVAFFLIFREAKRRSTKFDAFIDKYILKVPVVGNILYQAIIARFARTLSTTFAAGVPLVDALTSVAGAAGNAVYREAIYKVRDDVTTGIQLHQALKTTNKFPVMLLQMTSIGEESGALDDMLEKSAVFYEEAVDNAVDNLTTLLEPMIMAVLGVLVGGLLIAMYLPIFKLGAVI
ncbi:type II secretion system F family protein [uncultured Porticoccus sp.]|uniref:type II secretion system F family protein n=1 Tax=uncultured Porticoccus sp. TaxID=1256050 RepID=UPI0030DCC37D|tara:strand:- start:26176 stop:27384 length:1209 start_codon:yes stop_codon:yes gene_type:complete